MKAAKTDAKKNSTNTRSQPNINANIQADLDYHTIINEHIRSVYPNISNLSPDLLKSIDIPKHLLDSHASSKGKQKD